MANHYEDNGFWQEGMNSNNFDNAPNTEYLPMVEEVATKIDWKLKLSSRKFWTLVVGFITPLLLAFGVSQNIVTQVAAIIAAAGAVVAYLFAEGMVDASRENGDTHFYVNNGGTDGE